MFIEEINSIVGDLTRTVDEVFDHCGLETPATRGLLPNEQGRSEAGQIRAEEAQVLGGTAALVRKNPEKAASARLAPEVVGMIQQNCAAIIERFGYLAPAAMGRRAG